MPLLHLALSAGLAPDLPALSRVAPVEWFVAGGLAPASNVIVHELPAGDWGYRGATQAARRRVAQTV